MDLFKTKITKLRIALKSYESGLLNNSCQQILQVVNTDGSTRTVGPIPLPTRRRIYCVLRSPHVNKDAREHFEIRTHKRLIDIYQPTEEILQNLRNLDLPAGVDVEIKNI
uniref:ribosomal protein S10 n=1 Tax=Ochrosphaera neapolitana TaxID=35137 RepID=UPI00286CC895|nr:ribosomal protein S10 [Ochrosphaera neapolitana]WKK50113.1 ribosomal protein S10 [Ochrosphaera neapolitana]